MEKVWQHLVERLEQRPACSVRLGAWVRLSPLPRPYSGCIDKTSTKEPVSCCSCGVCAGKPMNEKNRSTFSPSHSGLFAIPPFCCHAPEPATGPPSRTGDCVFRTLASTPKAHVSTV